MFVGGRTAVPGTYIRAELGGLHSAITAPRLGSDADAMIVPGAQAFVIEWEEAVASKEGPGNPLIRQKKRARG
jgi:hypothetical protein